MDFSIVKKYENDPRFATLPISEQLELRAMMFPKVVEGDEKFEALSLEEKESFYRSFIYRVPKFENPDMFSNVAETASLYKAGDPNTVRSVHALAFGSAANQQLSLAQKTLKVMAKVDPKSEALYERIYGRDTRKLVEYYGYLASEDRQKGATYQMLQTTGSLTGFVADLVGYYRGTGFAVPGKAIWGGLPTRSIELLGKSIAAGVTGRMKNWALTSLLPRMVEATGEGITGVLRERMLENMNGVDNPEAKGFINTLKNFGQYAAMDYAIGLAAAVGFPLMGAFAKTVQRGLRGKALGTVKKGTLTAEEFADQLKRFAGGENLTAAQREGLSLETLDRLDHARNLIRAGEMSLDELLENPIARTTLGANQAHLAFVDDAGRYRLRDLDDTRVSKEFGTLVEAQKEVARKMDDILAKLDPAERVTYFNGSRDFLNIAGSMNKLDEVFDVAKRVAASDVPDPADVKILQAIEKGNFVSASARSAITSGEASKVMAEANDLGEVAYKSTIQLDNDMVARASQGRALFDDGASRIAYKAEGSDNVLVRLTNPASYSENMAARSLAERAVARTGKSSANIDDLKNSILMGKGYDGAAIDPDALLGYEVFYPEKLKLVDEAVSPVTGKFSTRGRTVKRIGDATDIGHKVFVEGELSARIGKEIAGADERLLVEAAASMTGTVDPADVKNVADMYLKRIGADIKDVIVKSTNNEEGYVFGRYLKGKQIQLDVPRSITKPSVQRTFIRTLFDSLNEVTKKSGTVGEWSKVVKARNFDRLFMKSRARFAPAITGTNELYEWMQDVVQSELSGVVRRTSNGIEVEIPGRALSRYGSVEDFVDGVFLDTLDIGTLRADLSRKGYTLVKSGGDWKVIGEGKKVVASGKTPREILERMNYRPEKIDSRFGPRVAAITDEGIELQVTAKTALGSRSSLLKYLDSFEDLSEMEKMSAKIGLENGTIYENVRSKWEVRMPRAGVIREFDNVKDARLFLREGLEEVDNLEEIARSKGLEVMYKRGQWNFYDVDNGKAFVARSLDDIEGVLKEYPDPTGAPSLLGAAIDADIEGVVNANALPASFRPVKPSLFVNPYKSFFTNSVEDWTADAIEKAPHDRIRTVTHFADLVTPFTDWLRKATKQSGHDELFRGYRGMEDAYRVARTEINTGNDLLAEALTETMKGSKREVTKRLKGISHYIEALYDTKQASYIGQSAIDIDEVVKRFDLRPVDTAAAESIHEMYNALFQKSGIDPHKLIYNYVPHLLEYSLKHADEVSGMSTATELAEKVFPGALPKEIAFWAENERLSDFLQVGMIDNAADTFMRYNAKMHKKLYMNEAWRNIDDYMRSNPVPDDIRLNINRYREEVMGIAHTSGEQKLMRGLTAFFRATGKNIPDAEKIAKETYAGLYSLNYLTNMGVRPFLAFRNMMQVFTTLAPRFGNTNVVKALKMVRDGGDEFVDALKRVGIVPHKPPVLGEILEYGFVGKVTHWALQMFKNSDEWTRAIGYATAKIQWDDAIAKFKKGIFKGENAIDDMLKYAGVNLVDPDEYLRIRSDVLSGNLTTALDKYASRVVDDTFFVYRTTNAPQAFKGVVGKMMGQYGTYAPSYIQNIEKGLRYGTPGQRVAFAARWLGNMGLLYASFNAVGMDAKNFLPWQPATFSGGPLFDLAYSSIKSVGGGYRGRQARAEVSRALSPVNFKKMWEGEPGALQYPTFYPGYFQYKSIVDARKYSERGESWLAWLALTSTPIAPDRR